MSVPKLVIEDEEDWFYINQKIWNLIKSTEQYDSHEFLSLDSSLNIEINDTQSESGYVSSPSSSSESRLTIKKLEKFNKNRIHVSNIPFSYKKNDLRALFSRFGEITSCEIISNAKGSKGFGFISFTKTNEADKAIQQMNGQLIDGRIFEVNAALPKAQKTSKANYRRTSESSITTSLASSKESIRLEKPFLRRIIKNEL